MGGKAKDLVEKHAKDSVGELLRWVFVYARKCAINKNYDTAENVCAITRLCFDVFLDVYGPNAKPPSLLEVSKFENGLKATVKSLEETKNALTEQNETSYSQLEDVRDYIINVQFRLKCISLYRQTGGAKTVMTEIRERLVDARKNSKLYD